MQQMILHHKREKEKRKRQKNDCVRDSGGSNSDHLGYQLTKKNQKENLFRGIELWSTGTQSDCSTAELLGNNDE